VGVVAQHSSGDMTGDLHDCLFSSAGFSELRDCSMTKIVKTNLDPRFLPKVIPCSLKPLISESRIAPSRPPEKNPNGGQVQDCSGPRKNDSHRWWTGGAFSLNTALQELQCQGRPCHEVPRLGSPISAVQPTRKWRSPNLGAVDGERYVNARRERSNERARCRGNDPRNAGKR